MVCRVVAAYGGMSKKTNQMFHAVVIRDPFIGGSNYGDIVNVKFIDKPFQGKIDCDYDFQFDSSGRVVDYKEIIKK